ncbi:hypothetical protein C9446_14250 [Providencia heimbachae]|uniref:hypothetical protein n=1 Tax=Providencia heimbachae TaxID=333962 RepID=UPI0010BEAB66|nr:hypothetical protein C9446_14250 [Providencia heimbachae]
MAIVQYYKAHNKNEKPESIEGKHRYNLESNLNFSLEDDDFELCIEECSEDYYDNHDGWEDRFPCFFMLWIDNEYLGMFEAELEFEPTFTVRKVE